MHRLTASDLQICDGWPVQHAGTPQWADTRFVSHNACRFAAPYSRPTTFYPVDDFSAASGCIRSTSAR